MRTKKPIYVAAIGLLLLLLVTVLVVAAHLWMDEIRQRGNPLFAVYPCIADPASWNGLTPGVSTRADVIERMGEPIDEHYREDYGYGWLIYLSENVQQSKARPEQWSDYVYIDSETETVLWIDEHVSNADGQFHLVAEVADEYGELIDQVYMNHLNSDLGSDEHIYVWAGCGLVLNAVPERLVRKNSDEPVSARATERPVDFYQLYQRFPFDFGTYILRTGPYIYKQSMRQRFNDLNQILESDPDFSDIQLDAKHVIWRRIYFAPTSYAEFEQEFQHSIRIKRWDLSSYRLLE